MAVLSCSAVNCVHNMSGLCSARKIEVDGPHATTSSNTECNTFASKGIKNAFTSMGNMNIGGEFKQVFDRDSIEMSPQIKCQAENCTYNEERICKATNVQINGREAMSSDSTQCETFRP